MARKNRVVVPGGTYHVTSRLAERARWLEDPAFKDEIVHWLHGIAEFSGVELLAWCIMDNHFHVLVHVPEVPEEYRIVPSEEPAAYAFGMRPAECNPPLWPSDGDSPLAATDGDSSQAASGDSPRATVRQVAGDGRLRPPTGFTLPDEEMVRRLAALYGIRRADMFRRRWEELRSKGQDAIVEDEKDRFCRRMYSLSPFVKTFKERIAYHVNKRLGRSGHVFEGRFFSGLVDEASAQRTVSLYIDYNPVRAGLADDPSGYAWCSYAAARNAGSAYCERCRSGYEATFGMDWADADRAMREAFRTRLPANARERLEKGEIRLSPSQIVHLRVPELSRGAYVSRRVDFARRALRRLARGFPAASARSLERLAAMVDWDAA